MTGRKQKKVDIRADYRSSIYKPNYEIVTPKYIRRKTKLEKFQNFKRYAVGKIIRNYYCFSPSDYFIFDINKNNRTFDKNYINKINIKYNEDKNEGICINIKKNCKDFKMIINSLI